MAPIEHTTQTPTLPTEQELEDIADTKQARKDLDYVIQNLKESSRKSAERDWAIHYITNAVMWLGMDLKAQNTPNPYPESKNPESTRIEPTADGLKL